MIRTVYVDDDLNSVIRLSGLALDSFKELVEARQWLRDNMTPRLISESSLSALELGFVNLFFPYLKDRGLRPREKPVKMNSWLGKDFYLHLKPLVIDSSLHLAFYPSLKFKTALYRGTDIKLSLTIWAQECFVSDDLMIISQLFDKPARTRNMTLRLIRHSDLSWKIGPPDLVEPYIRGLKEIFSSLAPSNDERYAILRELRGFRLSGLKNGQMHRNVEMEYIYRVMRIFNKTIN